MTEQMVLEPVTLTMALAGEVVSPNPLVPSRISAAPFPAVPSTSANGKEEDELLLRIRPPTKDTFGSPDAAATTFSDGPPGQESSWTFVQVTCPPVTVRFEVDPVLPVRWQLLN